MPYQPPSVHGRGLVAFSGRHHSGSHRSSPFLPASFCPLVCLPLDCVVSPANISRKPDCFGASPAAPAGGAHSLPPDLSLRAGRRRAKQSGGTSREAAVRFLKEGSASAQRVPRGAFWATRWLLFVASVGFRGFRDGEHTRDAGHVSGLPMSFNENDSRFSDPHHIE